MGSGVDHHSNELYETLVISGKQAPDYLAYLVLRLLYSLVSLRLAYNNTSKLGTTLLSFYQNLSLLLCGYVGRAALRERATSSNRTQAALS